MATNITPLHDRVIIKRIEDNVNQTLSLPVQANIKKTARVRPLTSRLATVFFSANIRAARSNSTATNSSLCVRTRSSASLTGPERPRSCRVSELREVTELETLLPTTLKLSVTL